MFLQKSEVRNLFNRIGGALLMFLLVFNLLVGGAGSLKTILTRTDSSTITFVITDLIQSFAYLIAFSVPVWFFFQISKEKTVYPLGLSLERACDQSVLSLLSILFLGTAFCFIASYVNSFLAPISEDASELLSSDLDQGYKLVLMFISTAIIPAFVEELLFRGLILSQIKPYSELGAILISAILFGLMHQTTFQFFYTTVLGVILAVVRIKTGSIWACVLLHFFNNFISVIQSYLVGLFDEKTGNTVYMITMLSIIVVGLILGTLFYFFSVQSGSPKAAKWGKPLALKRECAVVYQAFLSPTVIIYAVICAVTMISTAVMLGGS